MSTLQDLKLAIRQLARRPWFALSGVLTLGIGMGVNAIAFTVVNGLLFKHSEIRDSDDLGRLATTPGGEEGGYASLEEYRRFQAATRGAVELAAEGRLSLAWRRGATTEPAWVLFVSPNYFSMLPVEPIAGRVDVSPGANRPPSVVVGERFWRRKLASAAISGLTLRLNNVDVGVAGVMPESFTGPSGLYSPDVWLPLGDLALFRTSASLQKTDYRWLFLMGRLAPGSSVPEVQGRLDTAVSAMAKEWPASHRERGARFRLFKEGNAERRAIGSAAMVVMGLIGMVLLLACFNVATLLLARAVERERDMGLRAALGAGALRLTRLVLTEGVVLASLAGVMAVALARWTQALVGSVALSIDQPQHIDLTPDGTVIGFVLLLVVVAGVLPGLWPATMAVRVDLVRVLGAPGGQSAGGRPSPMRRWLVRAQVVGSTAFLAMAVLFAQSYGRLSIADLGFASDRLLIAEFEPAAHGYDAEGAQRYAEALTARVGALPGVAAVALADRAPFFIGFEHLTPVSSAGNACRADKCPSYATMAVGPGYFRTMGIALAGGREFEAGRGGSEQAIVNGPLARDLWQEGRGIGQTIRIGEREEPVTVVGVTTRTQTRGLEREQPTLYVPVGPDQFPSSLTLIVRTAMPPEELIRPVREAAMAIDPNVPLWSLRTMRERVDIQLWPFRTLSWLFWTCGLLALALTTVGLTAVVVHAVNQRRREFGVRMSLGARRGDIVLEVLRSSAILLAPGLVIGILLAAVGAHVAQAAFVGVDVLNPLSYALVATAESVIVGLACLWPALKASRADPLTVLRAE
jgi:predicted permease